MPIGEFIGEVLLRGVFEIIFYTLAYCTGAIVLWILTLGRIKLAPLSSIETANRGKNRWTDWSIWLHRGSQNRLLKAEVACIAGMIFWASVAVGIYFAFTGDNSDSEQPGAANDHSMSMAFDVKRFICHERI